MQSNSSRRRLIVDDDHEDLTPAGNVTSSKLQAVQFELPETATNATTSLNRPSPSPSISTALIAQELIQQSFEQNEVAPIQTPHNSLITAYPFTNSNALSIIKEEGSLKELIGAKDYLISEEKNARGNFEHIVYSIQLFKELGWSFHDFFIGFEEMVMTVRQNLLKDAPLLQDSTVVAIKKVVIPKSREGSRIAVNVLERKNSYRRARQFITTFSLQIFELFQAFHKCKDASSSNLPLSITQLWPWVSITYEEMRDLISLLSDCIGQITNPGRSAFNKS